MPLNNEVVPCHIPYIEMEKHVSEKLSDSLKPSFLVFARLQDDSSTVSRFFYCMKRDILKDIHFFSLRAMGAL